MLWTKMNDRQHNHDIKSVKDNNIKLNRKNIATLQMHINVLINEDCQL